MQIAAVAAPLMLLIRFKDASQSLLLHLSLESVPASVWVLAVASTSGVGFVCLINLPGKRQFEILAAIGKQQPEAPAGCSSCNNGHSNSNSNISHGCNYSYSSSSNSSHDYDYDYGIRCEDKGNQLTVAIVSLGNSTKLQLSLSLVAVA